MKFRLADVSIHWSGVDSRTPPGHCLADGRDSLENFRTWLFRGDEPSDDGYVGNVLWPGKSGGFRLSSYDRSGAYFASGGDSGELLGRLAEAATDETENPR